MLEVSNAAFLEAIQAPSKAMGNLPDDATMWVCHKKDAICGLTWSGQAYDSRIPIDFEDENAFFCVSMLQSNSGRLGRKKENFLQLICLVLDDVGTKAKEPPLEPSWKIETSPSNFQYGYILEHPIKDILEAELLVNALIAVGYCDAGATGPATRYMRLPVGSNTKPEHIAKNEGNPFRHRVTHWEPNNSYSVDQLVKELGLNLADKKERPSKSQANVNGANDAELVRRIMTHESYHTPMLSLAARYIGRGMSRNDAISVMEGLIKANEDDSERKLERLEDIPRLVETAFKKFSNESFENKNFEILPASEFIKGSPPEWRVKAVLPKHGLAMIYGESGAGKSFFTLDLVANIARGTDWNSHKVKQGRVVYIVTEGTSGFRSRIKSYSTHNKIDLQKLPLNIIADTPDFTRDEDLPLIEAINNSGGADVIVIDTLAQVSAGANENSGEDMGALLKRCQRLQKQTDALVILVHHSGKNKDRGARGWSGLKAAMDTEIEITIKKPYNEAKITKQKDGEANSLCKFQLNQVKLGKDSDGDIITSCIVAYEDPSKQYPKLPTGKFQRLIIEALLPTQGSCIGHTMDVVINYVQEKRDKTKTSNRPCAPKRTIERMIDDGTIEFSGGTLKIPHNHIYPQSHTNGKNPISYSTPSTPQHPIRVWSSGMEEGCVNDLLQ